MATDAVTHHVFVDFENVPDVDLGLIEGHAARVTLLIGKRQNKIELALVRQIHRLAGQVELVDVGASGRNALDLTLAHYLGRAVQGTPGLKFAIVSRDKDFDPLIAHLRTVGVAITRHDRFAVLPFLTPAGRAAAAKPATQGTVAQPKGRLLKLAGQLKDNSTSRPRTKARLLSRINADLGGKLSETEKEESLNELVRMGIVSMDAGGKVHYPEAATQET